MFVQGPGLVGAARQVIVTFLAVVERPTRQVGDLLVEHAGVARKGHVPGNGVRQPQVVVRASRADAAPTGRAPPMLHVPLTTTPTFIKGLIDTGRVPPMLHVPLDKLPLGATQEMLPGQIGHFMQEGHTVLELIAEAVCPARLVEAATAPHAARKHLVRQPAVHQHVQGGIRRLGVEHAQFVIPELPDLLQRDARGPDAPVALDQRDGFRGVVPGAEDKNNLPLFPCGKVHPCLHRGARVQTRPQPPAQSPQA